MYGSDRARLLCFCSKTIYDEITTKYCVIYLPSRRRSSQTRRRFRAHGKFMSDPAAAAAAAASDDDC